MQRRFDVLSTPIFQGYIGLELINRFNVYASEMLGHHIEGVFVRYSPSWWFCEDLFQEWYLGEELYTQTYDHAPAQSGKSGCIHFEQPLLPAEQMSTTLQTLREQGYTLGVATGRQRQEGIAPLKNYDLFQYFDQQHITSHDEIACAEAELRTKGDAISLVKPHPYQFLLAADPTYQFAQPPPLPGSFVVVGDTPSDVLGARAAGAITVAVLTGARTPEALTKLEQSQPDFIIDDMTSVPELLAYIDDLATIQRLQFTEREKAELLLQRWFLHHMNLRTESVTLTPRAVSLNSFNGVYRVDGEEYFFKTHVEDQGVLEEYYHAELLHNAGYNIVRPLRTLHQKGQQMVIYPVVHSPVMFDLMRAVETGKTEDATVEILAAAEKRECERLLAIYQATLAPSTAEEHVQAPIHQLFWHRLTGGRLAKFYHAKHIPFAGTRNESILFDELLRYHWVINGVAQKWTLGELIERAKIVLDPARPSMTVIGHGDAHFGNVFLEQQDYLYFDPAFAGRHSPLLDIVKPLFHNIFATWMYFPRDIACNLSLTLSIEDTTIIVGHTYDLTPLRREILRTKVEYLLTPLIAWLHALDVLPADWQEMLRLALMCCPLLTINLLDAERIPTVISWLGLSQAVQMGNMGIEPWRIEG